MARGKKSRKTQPTPQPAPETRTKESEPKKVMPRRFYWYDYLAVSLIFVAFAYLQKFVTMQYLGSYDFESLAFESMAVDFFFDTLWKGFLVVALLVWLHDFFYRDVEDQDGA